MLKKTVNKYFWMNWVVGIASINKYFWMNWVVGILSIILGATSKDVLVGVLGGFNLGYAVLGTFHAVSETSLFTNKNAKKNSKYAE